MLTTNLHLYVKKPIVCFPCLICYENYIFYCNHTMHLIQVQILVLPLNVKMFLILYFIPQGMDGITFNLRFLRSSTF